MQKVNFGPHPGPVDLARTTVPEHYWTECQAARTISTIKALQVMDLGGFTVHGRAVPAGGYLVETDLGIRIAFEQKTFETAFQPVTVSLGPHIAIKFQDGPVKDGGVNGCQIEDVIDLLVARLTGFQNGMFPCTENGQAIIHLTEATMWLRERTRRRQLQGVEGT